MGGTHWEGSLVAFDTSQRHVDGIDTTRQYVDKMQ
jgi:hypothetical protein